MDQTPVTLLNKLRNSPTEADWQRLVGIYEPFIRLILSRHLRPQDAADNTQDILVVLLRKLPEFKHQGVGTFRSWLRVIVARRVSLFFRRVVRQPGQLCVGQTNALANLADPNDRLARQFDEEHQQFAVHRLLFLLGKELGEDYAYVIRRIDLEQASRDMVAAEMGKRINAIYIMSCRARKWLLENGQEFLE